MPMKTCKNCDSSFRWMPSQTSGECCGRDCSTTFLLRKKIESGEYTKNTALTFFKRTAEYKCNECGVHEWNNKPLRLQIDHIDGDITNNKIENFRYLCPNCHTQTPTWGVKNVSEEGRRRMNEGGLKGLKSQHR